MESHSLAATLLPDNDFLALDRTAKTVLARLHSQQKASARRGDETWSNRTRRPAPAVFVGSVKMDALDRSAPLEPAQCSVRMKHWTTHTQRKSQQMSKLKVPGHAGSLFYVPH